VARGVDLEQAAAEALGEVGELGGIGGLVAVDSQGNIAMPFSSEAMPRGTWRAGQEPAAWV
jgi:beta-aspartyl-peptidase (threonine type)